MKGPNARTTFGAIINAAFWGFLLSTGLTLLGLILHALVYGVFWGNIPVVTFLPDFLVKHSSLGHLAHSDVIFAFSGIPFVIIVNTLFGTFAFAVAAAFWRVLIKSSRENGGK
jgi:hypothetical protein